MVAISSDLAGKVRLFLEAGDREFLDTLNGMDRNSIEGQAVVRYLMQLKHWPATADSDFSTALDHLFAEYPERAKRSPQEYRDTTFALIKNTFDYECVVVVVEEAPKAEPVAKKPKAPKESTRKVLSTNTEPRSTDINTDGASDRLKNVIAIQRAG